MSKNRKIYTVNGFTGTLGQIAKHHGIKHRSYLAYWIQKYGMSIEEAIMCAKDKSCRQKKNENIYTVNGFSGNLKEIAEHFDIPPRIIRFRQNNMGMTLEEAVSIPVNKAEYEVHTVNGFTGTLGQIAKHHGIKYNTLYVRIHRDGMSIEDAVNIDIGRIKRGQIYTVNGFTGTLKEIAEHFDINPEFLRRKISQCGMSIEEAVNCERWKGKTYTVNGFTGNIREIAEHFGIKSVTLRQRIMNHGMTIEEAVNHQTGKRIKSGKIYTVNGFTGTLQEISDHFEVKMGTIHSRMRKHGMSLEEAVKYKKKKGGRKSKIYTVNGVTGNIREIAEHFGINEGTLRGRMSRKNMSIEEAVNITIEHHPETIKKE